MKENRFDEYALRPLIRTGRFYFKFILTPRCMSKLTGLS
jgi:hypothetical protein